MDGALNSFRLCHLYFRSPPCSATVLSLFRTVAFRWSSHRSTHTRLRGPSAAPSLCPAAGSPQLTARTALPGGEQTPCPFASLSTKWWWKPCPGRSNAAQLSFEDNAEAASTVKSFPKAESTELARTWRVDPPQSRSAHPAEPPGSPLPTGAATGSSLPYEDILLSSPPVTSSWV